MSFVATYTMVDEGEGLHHAPNPSGTYFDVGETQLLVSSQAYNPWNPVRAVWVEWAVTLQNIGNIPISVAFENLQSVPFHMSPAVSVVAVGQTVAFSLRADWISDSSNFPSAVVRLKK